MKKPELGKSRGLVIALFGPDGVGKSAVIEQVRARVGDAFSGVSQYHFRPMMGCPPARHFPVRDPHGRGPRGLLISVVKLIYWLLDCWCGYLIAIRPGLRQSRLVIFDRYFPDVVVDPRRYRLPASVMGFAKWLVRLAPGPDLHVLLDAPVAVIQRRKAEVSHAETLRQRAAYLAMFQLLPDKLIVNADRPVDEVARHVATAVFLLLTSRKFEQPENFAIADL